MSLVMAVALSTNRRIRSWDWLGKNTTAALEYLKSTIEEGDDTGSLIFNLNGERAVAHLTADNVLSVQIGENIIPVDFPANIDPTQVHLSASADGSVLTVHDVATGEPLHHLTIDNVHFLQPMHGHHRP